MALEEIIWKILFGKLTNVSSCSYPPGAVEPSRTKVYVCPLITVEGPVIELILFLFCETRCSTNISSFAGDITGVRFVLCTTSI